MHSLLGLFWLFWENYTLKNLYSDHKTEGQVVLITLNIAIYYNLKRKILTTIFLNKFSFLWTAWISSEHNIPLIYFDVNLN